MVQPVKCTFSQPGQPNVVLITGLQRMYKALVHNFSTINKAISYNL